jgi:hypothetical protein
MPDIICAKCGGDTKTAVSMWLPSRFDGKAHWCYAKIHQGHWVKGCCYNLATPSQRHYVDSLLNEYVDEIDWPDEIIIDMEN